MPCSEIGCNSHFHLKDVLLTEPLSSEEATRNAEWNKGCLALSCTPAAVQHIRNFSWISLAPWSANLLVVLGITMHVQGIVDNAKKMKTIGLM